MFYFEALAGVTWTLEKTIGLTLLGIAFILVPIVIILDIVRVHYRQIKKYGIADKILQAMMILTVIECLLVFGLLIWVMCF